MNNVSVRKLLITVSMLVLGLTATTVSATWYVNQSEGYYKPKNYHNEKYGDFVPTDIHQKLFGHLNTYSTQEENKTLADTSLVESGNNQTIAPGNQPPGNQQTSNQAQNFTQQYPQPTYNRYNQNRKYASPANGRNNRSTNFNGPWNNGSSVSGPWNSKGSNFSNPWNSNGSNFSGPWKNNGSNFSMPWGNNRGNNRGNNNGSNMSPFGNGGGWNW